VTEVERNRTEEAVEVDIEGRALRLTNLDKVLWPRLGLTKRWLIDYYLQVAPILLPHVQGHPLTLHRFPDGVAGIHWYETRARSHPDWVRTVTFRMERTGKVFDVVVVDDVASLAWTAQIATIELHPYLGCADALAQPRVAVFDLDPGPPADVLDCCDVALRLRRLLDDLALASFVKTSGVKGLHVYVPLNLPHTYEETKTFARAVAQLLARDRPEQIVATMTTSMRTGKVFIDWSQNDAGKSTVAPYSLRGLEYPTVSTPLRWEEVEDAVRGGDRGSLVFLPDDVLARLAAGDVFAPVVDLQQPLPAVDSD
jgi:bifunctional non-homologous end joining protein LigD